MVKSPWDVGSESITQAEHISPNKTGDNIEAKKVAGYVFNESTLEWQRDNNVDPATSAKQDDQITQLANLLTELKQKTEPSDIQNIELINAIRAIFQQIAMPSWYDPTTNTLRIGNNTVTFASNQDIRTVTNLTNFGTSPADVMARDISINTWANNVRTTIT